MTLGFGLAGEEGVWLCVGKKISPWQGTYPWFLQFKKLGAELFEKRGKF